MVANRFDVFLISLDPTRGSEIRKTRPCLIISPDEMNDHIGTVIVAPMTTKGRPYPSRMPCKRCVCRMRGGTQPPAGDSLKAAPEE